jgi:hypothetical protein
VATPFPIRFVTAIASPMNNETDAGQRNGATAEIVPMRTTRAAPATPATPAVLLDVRRNTASSVSCCTGPRGGLVAWAMKTVAIMLPRTMAVNAAQVT